MDNVVVLHSSVVEMLDAERKSLREENDRLKAKLKALIDALPDTRRLLLAREDALKEIQ